VLLPVLAGLAAGLGLGVELEDEVEVELELELEVGSVPKSVFVYESMAGEWCGACPGWT
jgi:hypothetical protein